MPIDPSGVHEAHHRGCALAGSFSAMLVLKNDTTGLATPIMIVSMAIASGLLLRQMNALRRRAFWAWRNECEARAGLLRSTESLRRVFMAVPVPFVLANASSGRIVHANDLAVTTLQLDLTDFGQEHIADLLASAADVPALRHLIDSSATVDRREWKIRTSRGNEFETLLSMSRVDYEGEACTVLGFTDISEMKRLERELYRQAAFDLLTGLCNRRNLQRIRRRPATAHKKRGVHLAVNALRSPGSSSP